MAAMNELLEVTRNSAGFRIAGEIDLSNVDLLATAVSSEVKEGNHLVLDCSELRFVDSTGMAALIGICKGLGVTGRLTLTAVPAPVAKAAHVLGLDRIPNLEISFGPPPGAAAIA